MCTIGWRPGRPRYQNSRFVCASIVQGKSSASMSLSCMNSSSRVRRMFTSRCCSSELLTSVKTTPCTQRIAHGVALRSASRCPRSSLTSASAESACLRASLSCSSATILSRYASRAWSRADWASRSAAVACLSALSRATCASFVASFDRFFHQKEKAAPINETSAAMADIQAGISMCAPILCFFIVSRGGEA